MFQAKRWPECRKCQHCPDDVYCEKHRTWKLYKWKKCTQSKGKVFILQELWHFSDQFTIQVNKLHVLWFYCILHCYTVCTLVLTHGKLFFVWIAELNVFGGTFGLELHTFTCYTAWRKMDPSTYLMIFVFFFRTQYTFLPRLKADFENFSAGWNDHPIRKEGFLSPNHLWEIGMLRHPIRESEMSEENAAVE